MCRNNYVYGLYRLVDLSGLNWSRTCGWVGRSGEKLGGSGPREHGSWLESRSDFRVALYFSLCSSFFFSEFIFQLYQYDTIYHLFGSCAIALLSYQIRSFLKAGTLYPYFSVVVKTGPSIVPGAFGHSNK